MLVRSNVGRLVLAGIVACLCAAYLLGSIVPADANGKPKRGPIIVPDAKLDERTRIAPSRIPGSGNGLFANVKIKEGEIVGELGGELLEEIDIERPSAYLAGLPDCAFNQIPPYRYLDSKDHGGHVSRINFAPSRINGQDTNFQNTKITRVCQSPWIVFTATRDIEPGEEMWASYGPHYYYHGFMGRAEVRDFFCALAKVDCSKEYEFDH